MNKLDNQIDTLILGVNIKQYIYGSDEVIKEVYRKSYENKIIRFIRKICLLLNGMFASNWFGEWYACGVEYKKIILFDTGNQKYILQLLKKRWPSARIILWYWNPISRTASMDGIDRTKIEVWSYHKEDCKKYHLRYNSQFYIGGYKKKSETVVAQDVYFVGADKDRTPLLVQMKDEFEKYGLKYKYILTRCKGIKESSIKYSDPISSDKNLENIYESKAVIDIVDKEQFSGFTLRPFETMVARKKLITNNPMVKKLKFYCTENVFIWGEDSDKDLVRFINSPINEIYAEKVQFYEFNNWIKRFDGVKG